MKMHFWAAVAVASLGLTGIAQAGSITGFTLVTNTPDGNGGPYTGQDPYVSNVSFTADSISFKTRSVGISNAVGPYLAVFQIDSTSPLSGENFLGCAELPGNPCVLNSGLNVFTPGFGSSGDQAVVNDTIEWSDPVGLTGFADPSDELAAVENGGLLAEITGDQLKIWDYCPSSCGVTGLDWTFQNLGPTAPEPDSIMLFASGFLGLGVMTYRKRKSVA